MRIGVNVDPRHGYDPADVLAPGSVDWVRSVVRPDHDLTPWLQAVRAAGGSTLVVCARESLKRGWSYATMARTYARRYGPLVDAWQFGNEPDVTSPSSWALPAAKLTTLLRAARAALPDALLIGPGLVSGNPAYLDDVDLSSVDAIALHPYGRGPSTTEPYAFGAVADLVQVYRRAGKPIWVSEFGGPDRDFADEAARAAYHGTMLLALRDADVGAAIQFCWADSMVPGFGLVDAQGVAKESYAAFYAGAIAAQFAPEPEVDFAAQLIAGIDDAVGLPYIFGGRDLGTQAGFDCAGFVMEAYFRQGVNLCFVPPWTDDRFPSYQRGKWFTSAQRLFDNPRIPHVAEPEPGDLVYFEHTYNTPDRITHVALVTEPGVMLGAQGARSGYVGYLGSAYWRGKLAGYGRPER